MGSKYLPSNDWNFHNINRIKKEQLNTVDEEKSDLEKNKNALFDAIDTFLTFVNLFMHLLNLMGSNRSAEQAKSNETINTNGMNFNNFVYTSQKKAPSVDNLNFNNSNLSLA